MKKLYKLMLDAIRVPAVRTRTTLLAGVPAIVAGGTASALTINLTFDTDANFMAAGLTATDIVNMKAACNYAALQFTDKYTDNINVNIMVTAVAGTGTLGESNTFIFSVADYTTRPRLGREVQCH
jgi:hypothetical protein